MVHPSWQCRHSRRGRKAAFVVNSYEQCELLYQHIRQQFPAWSDRVRYLVRGGVLASNSEHGITASEVERLGGDRDWDLFIFPMNAIGRGVSLAAPVARKGGAWPSLRPA
jgi:hypothetical protein